jgi:hypothetical protein
VPEQGRCRGIFRQFLAVLDMIMFDRAACDHCPTSLAKARRQIGGHLGMGGLAIPFGIVELLAVRSLADAVILAAACAPLGLGACLRLR